MTNEIEFDPIEFSEIPASASVGLDDLSEIELSPPTQSFYDRITEKVQGPAVWASRKRREVHDLLVLSEMAPRFHVDVLDPRVDLKALLRIQCPVPCLPPGSEGLIIASEVVLALSYPQEVLHQSLPGYGFLNILSPGDVWLANTTFGGPVQKVCLGVTMPVGIRTVELLLAVYGAITLQTVQIDEEDRAGVFNTEAARYYQQRKDIIPLSRVPFLGTADLEGATP